MTVSVVFILFKHIYQIDLNNLAMNRTGNPSVSKDFNNRLMDVSIKARRLTGQKHQ